MYIPKVFDIENKNELFKFIDQWSFGDLVTTCGGEILINHLPFIVDKNQAKLYGHFAVNNPQLALLEKADDLLIVFKGAHAYISPSWYVSQEMVPTWNFESVQVQGKASIVTNDKLLYILEQLTAKHESQFEFPWTIEQVSAPKLKAMMAMIVGFEIEIVSIQGKSKLSQNRSREDRTGVISGLKNQQEYMSTLIAEKMTSNLGTWKK